MMGRWDVRGGRRFGGYVGLCGGGKYGAGGALEGMGCLGGWYWGVNMGIRGQVEGYGVSLGPWGGKSGGVGV